MRQRRAAADFRRLRADAAAIAAIRLRHLQC